MKLDLDRSFQVNPAQPSLVNTRHMLLLLVLPALMIPGPPPLCSTEMEEQPAVSVARGRFVVWLHGLGDSGPANEPVADHFSAFAAARWAFPTAPAAPVTCNRGMVMPSWFDIHDTPITSKSVKGEEDVLRAVESVHAMIDREIESAGTSPEDVFVFGLSQGGALAIASVLLYPRTLGGCAVFSGFLPLDDASFAARVTPDASKTPVLWIHGRADSLVPFQAGQDGIKFLRGLGLSCQFKAYEGLGHELAPYELEHCQRWAESVSSERGRRRLDRAGGGGVTRRANKCCVLFNFLSRRR